MDAASINSMRATSNATRMTVLAWGLRVCHTPRRRAAPWRAGITAVSSDTSRVFATPEIATAVRNSQHVCGSMPECIDLPAYSCKLQALEYPNPSSSARDMPACSPVLPPQENARSPHLNQPIPLLSSTIGAFEAPFIACDQHGRLHHAHRCESAAAAHSSSRPRYGAQRREPSLP